MHVYLGKEEPFLCVGTNIKYLPNYTFLAKNTCKMSSVNMHLFPRLPDGLRAIRLDIQIGQAEIVE